MSNEQQKHLKPEFSGTSGLPSPSESGKTDRTQESLPQGSTAKSSDDTNNGIEIVDATNDPHAIAWQPHRSITPNDCR